MPPIFYNGIECNDVYFNGVKTTGFLNGNQIWGKTGPVGTAFSASGTFYISNNDTIHVNKGLIKPSIVKSHSEGLPDTFFENLSYIYEMSTSGQVSGWRPHDVTDYCVSGYISTYYKEDDGQFASHSASDFVKAGNTVIGQASLPSGSYSAKLRTNFSGNSEGALVAYHNPLGYLSAYDSSAYNSSYWFASGVYTGHQANLPANKLGIKLNGWKEIDKTGDSAWNDWRLFVFSGGTASAVNTMLITGFTPNLVRNTNIVNAIHIKYSKYGSSMYSGYGRIGEIALPGASLSGFNFNVGAFKYPTSPDVMTSKIYGTNWLKNNNTISAGISFWTKVPTHLSAGYVAIPKSAISSIEA